MYILGVCGPALSQDTIISILSKIIMGELNSPIIIQERKLDDLKNELLLYSECKEVEYIAECTEHFLKTSINFITRVIDKRRKIKILWLNRFIYE